MTVLFCCSGELYMFPLPLKALLCGWPYAFLQQTPHSNGTKNENHFTSIDSARDFFLAIIIFISFSDICLDIAVLALKLIVIEL